jgi:hypothetical protein
MGEGIGCFRSWRLNYTKVGFLGLFRQWRFFTSQAGLRETEPPAKAKNNFFGKLAFSPACSLTLYQALIFNQPIMNNPSFCT